MSKDHLRTALNDLAEEFGLSRLRENSPIKRGTGSAIPVADLVVSTPNRDYDLGFVKEGSAYDLVADWYGLKGLDHEAFISRLSQRYAYHAVRGSLDAQGFALIEEEIDDRKTIHLRMRRLL